MDSTKDYYRVLGVSENAEDVVIQAAYRALAKKYHPDSNPAHSENAWRMVEVNEAYSVLSDPRRRAEYDKARGRHEFDPSTPTAAEDVMQEISADWERAIEYLPNLKTHAEELRQLSPSLELAFKVTLLENKNFSDAKKVAAEIESSYLSQFFGSRPTIRTFAKELILGGYKDAAKELNAAIRVLGSNVDDQVVIDVVSRKFPVRPTRDAEAQPEVLGPVGSVIVLTVMLLIFLLFILPAILPR